MIISTATEQQVPTTERFSGWDGVGMIATAPTPARDLFEQANALFGVETRELLCPVTTTPEAPRFDAADVETTQPAGVFGVVRTDTQTLLGVVSKQYEVVPNSSLLRMAEFIREEVEMDSVVVMSNGQRVAFTANVLGASQDIVPGDTVKRRIVGYLGHDGKSGCGAMFTNIRVVCSNTLASAKRDAEQHVSIRHKNGANENFDALIQSINCARQTFAEDCELMRALTQQGMTRNQFNEFVDELYKVQEGDVFRKRDRLESAFQHGYGWHYAEKSLWSAVNAVTQVETSPKTMTGASAIKRFQRANFGAGLTISQQAMGLAQQLLTT